MKLYGNAFSTCTRKVLCTFAEKGQTPEFIALDFGKGEHKSADNLARQPFGKVPAIDDNGFKMYESRAIIRYLDETLPGPKLTPSDAKGRAMMEMWTSNEYSYFSGPAMKIVSQKMMVPMRGGTTDMAIVDAAKNDLQSPLDVLDKHFASSTYMVGDQFTLADVTYMPYVEYLFACGEGDLITSRKHLASWWNRVSERPSWKKTTGKA